MGVLTKNRKRGKDSRSLLTISPTDQSYVPILKKPKFSASVNEEIDCPISTSSVVSRMSLYPDSFSGFPREVHAPIRKSRLGFFSFGRNFEKRHSAMRRFFGYGKKKKAESGTVRNSNFKRKQKYWNVEKEQRSFDSPVVTDKSNRNAKLDVEDKMDSIMSGQESNALPVPVDEKFYDSAKKRNDRFQCTNFFMYVYTKFLKSLQLMCSSKEDKLKIVLGECFTPLTAVEEDEVTLALSNFSRRKVLVIHESSGIDITGEILRCLSPRQWLNDEVINLYLELLKEREKRDPKKFLKCHFFNTFFYPKLISGRNGYNFHSVRKWTSMRRLGYSLQECDKIFVPIHQKMHWSLAIINKKDQKFQYLDSLKSVDSHVLNVLARYYVDEVKEKNGKELKVGSWEREFVEDLPRQKNGFDCGVFMIKYADFHSKDLGLCFSQDNIPYFRRRIANEILKSRAE